MALAARMRCVATRRASLAVRRRSPYKATLHRDQARVPFTEEQLTAMRGGLTAEEYRWKLIRELLD